MQDWCSNWRYCMKTHQLRKWPLNSSLPCWTRDLRAALCESTCTSGPGTQCLWLCNGTHSGYSTTLALQQCEQDKPGLQLEQQSTFQQTRPHLPVAPISKQQQAVCAGMPELSSGLGVMHRWQTLPKGAQMQRQSTKVPLEPCYESRPGIC